MATVEYRYGPIGDLKDNLQKILNQRTASGTCEEYTTQLLAQAAKMFAGSPNERLNKYSDSYRTSEETVIVGYTRGLRCGSGQNDSRWRVPHNSVESILVTPTRSLRFSELRKDTSTYRQEQDQHRREDIHYINDQTGEEIVVFMGEVRSLRYYPAAIDKHLLCPTPLPLKSKRRR